MGLQVCNFYVFLVPKLRLELCVQRIGRTAWTRFYQLYVGLPNFVVNHKVTKRIYRVHSLLFSTDLYSFAVCAKDPLLFLSQ